MKIGEDVIWHDAEGTPHDALVTCVWSDTMINLVFVSGDESKQDSYGRQIERATSCQHVSLSAVHGYYWRKPEEKPNVYVEPQSK